MIKAENVTVAYERNIILKDIDLAVKPREFVVILGPNGSGKTTLLAMINGLARVKGHLTINGQEASKRTLPELRKGIAYVPQHWPIDPRTPISLLEMILSGRCGQKGLFRHYSAGEYKEAQEIGEKVGLGHLLDRPVGQLSGGEFQKGTIARAIFQEPYLFLLDEPTSSLDWQAARELIDLIHSLHEERQLTTLMVTHELQMIPSFASRIIVMRHGSIVADGPPEQILQADTFASILGWKLEFFNIRHDKKVREGP